MYHKKNKLKPKNWNEELSFFQRLFNILKQGFSTRISNILSTDFRKACSLAKQYNWTITWGKHFFLNLPLEELKDKEFKIQDSLKVKVYCLQENIDNQKVYKKENEKTLKQRWTIKLTHSENCHFYREWWKPNDKNFYFLSYSSWNNDPQEIILDIDTFSKIIKKLIWYDWFIDIIKNPIKT